MRSKKKSQSMQSKKKILRICDLKDKIQKQVAYKAKSG